MKEINFSTSACRYCRFYQPEGRRGGSCEMLSVQVQSSWKACAFASHPFKTTLKKLEDIFHLETPINRASNRNKSLSMSQVNLETSFQTTISRKLE